MRVDTVRTDAFTMDYLCFGEGKNVLVILPGLSVQKVLGFAEAIADAYNLLTKDFTIYLFERKNELPAVYKITDMAEDTVCAMRTLGLEKVCLFGASQGGMIAMQIAVRYPELVKRMIVGSTSAYISEEKNDVVKEWISLAKQGDAKELYLTFGEAINPPAVFEQLKDAYAAAGETVTAEELARFVILAEGMAGFNLLDELKKIACPILVIGSKDDLVLGAEASVQIAEHLNPEMPHELYLYEGYGHAAYDLAPDYRERMLAFLRCK
ncbi:MAG: alpha/beta hydrolase [Lachnospiraceae bacterium]|nr:alpha/beta hydrolase [Lachnospiraceae bacterium]